ncbi:hypothetical protein WJX84_000336 [Apatococcus fuscideae]|uniref:RAB6-interacting golgin n=1 Tax=Apatococcus fuscideae TaxID=2026836 RepID=A0AAW1SVF6_9CHLO
MEDASFRRAPITPDRVSPAREGQAAQRIDHDGFVKSICVSLERKIAEATKEQHTAQLAQSQKVAKTNELAGLRTDLRHERAENMVLRALHDRAGAAKEQAHAEKHMGVPERKGCDSTGCCL